MDRRRAERSAVGVNVRVARSDELRLPPARSVDISTCGVLLSFDEPVGFSVGQTVVASFVAERGDGPGPVLGHVRRSARGTDFHTYVAIEFDEDASPDAAGLVAALLDRDGFPHAAEGKEYS